MKKHLLLAVLSTFLLSFSAYSKNAQSETAQASTELATFAGGCFWCMEAPFDSIKGVKSVTVGYTGGQTPNPSYKDVSAGNSGHAEVVQIAFDPAVVTYEKLLEVFWRQIDPFRVNAQFCDQGSPYRSGIFYENDQQKKQAEASKEALNKLPKFKGKIVTEITRANTFYPAEEYHQQYYKKNPVRYKYYRFSCGRDQRLKEIWGSAGK